VWAAAVPCRPLPLEKNLKKIWKVPKTFEEPRERSPFQEFCGVLVIKLRI
jgi:hypothetical protein